MEFDDLDRLVRVIFPDGTTSGSIYDCCHLVGTYDQMGRGTQISYDVLGNTVKTVDPNGAETTYAYNENSWLVEVVDPRGNATTYEHDDVGKTTTVAFPGGWLEIMTYLDNGLLATLKNQKGMSNSTTALIYDDLYYLIKKDFPSGTDTEFEVDVMGRRTKMTDSSGEKRYTHDDANRLTKVVQGPIGFIENTDHNYKIEYQWNAASQLTQIKATVRTKSALQWDLTYTDDGLLDTITNPDSEVTKHEYLDDGRLKKITILHGTGNSATREYFYSDTDASHDYVAGKPKFLRKVLDKNHGGTPISSFEYELDLAGNRLGVTDKDNKYTRLVSDPSLQLRTETKWASKASSTRTYQYGFAYDENGNRLTQHKDAVLMNYSYGDNNEILTAGSDTFTHDIFGNIATKVNGGNTTTFGYDFERHLTSIDFPSTANDDSHQYDGDSVRMRSKLAGATDWTNFIQCPVTGALLGEYTLISSTYSITSVNTWGVGLISTNRGGTRRYFHFDGNGSTVALTEDDGTVMDTYVYSAFGVTESSSGASVNPFRFMGELGAYNDGAMGSNGGLILVGSGFYNPDNSIFIGPPGACFSACNARAQSAGFGPRQSCKFCNMLCKSRINCESRPDIPRIGAFADACIAMLCAMELAKSMLEDVTSAGSKGWGDVEDLAGRIRSGKTKKTELDDCIKRAKSRQGWIYQVCTHPAEQKYYYPMCRAISRTQDECLECCRTAFSGSSQEMEKNREWCNNLCWPLPLE